VGEGARIGSNAVVVKDVPPGATAVGIPARIILDDRTRRAKRRRQARVLRLCRYVQSGRRSACQGGAGLLDHSVDLDKRIELI